MPSWLPPGTDLPQYGAPSQVAQRVEPVYEQTAAAYQSPEPTPAWVSPQPPGASRTTIMLAAGAALILLAGGAGVYAILQSSNQHATDTSGGPTAAAATPSIVPSPSPSPVAVLPLTGQIGGDYCPVAHPNDAACWKGSFVNTGPPIGQLALIFVTGGGYEDWFAHHANGTLSGFYTTAGCSVDAAHSRMVCGSVPQNGRVDVYLGGDVTSRGTFHYAVKFADISSGSPVYVDQHADGTHDVVAWAETIT
jgi:hypothetical protein